MLLVIENSTKPPCLKNIKMETLSIDWTVNKKNLTINFTSIKQEKFPVFGQHLPSNINLNNTKLNIFS